MNNRDWFAFSALQVKFTHDVSGQKIGFQLVKRILFLAIISISLQYFGFYQGELKPVFVVHFRPENYGHCIC